MNQRKLAYLGLMLVALTSLSVVSAVDSSSLSLNVSWKRFTYIHPSFVDVFVNGTLTDTTTNQPIANAPIQVTGSWTQTTTDFTDSNGYYSFVLRGPSSPSHGTFSVTTSYAGDGVHSPVSATQSFTIS